MFHQTVTSTGTSPKQTCGSNLNQAEPDEIQSQLADLHRVVVEINQILRRQSAGRSADQISEDKLRCQALVSEAQQIYIKLPCEWQIKLCQISKNLFTSLEL